MKFFRKLLVKYNLCVRFNNTCDVINCAKVARVTLESEGVENLKHMTQPGEYMECFQIYVGSCNRKQATFAFPSRMSHFNVSKEDMWAIRTQVGQALENWVA